MGGSGIDTEVRVLAIPEEFVADLRRWGKCFSEQPFSPFFEEAGRVVLGAVRSVSMGDIAVSNAFNRSSARPDGVV